jgi:hypothetical protein
VGGGRPYEDFAASGKNKTKNHFHGKNPKKNLKQTHTFFLKS